MNLTLLSLGLAAALLTSGVIAAQPYGRDSVYANSGATAQAPATDNGHNRYGRDSMYANDRPALNVERSQIGEADTYKPGRA
jgi:hypothetical protein